MLPPLFGTMLSVGPPTSASPRPPEVVVTTSCGVRDVGDVGRDAAAVKRGAGVEAVHLHAAFVAAAARAAEDRHLRRDLDVALGAGRS